MGYFTFFFLQTFFYNFNNSEAELFDEIVQFEVRDLACVPLHPCVSCMYTAPACTTRLIYTIFWPIEITNVVLFWKTLLLRYLPPFFQVFNSLKFRSDALIGYFTVNTSFSNTVSSRVFPSQLLDTGCTKNWINLHNVPWVEMTKHFCSLSHLMTVLLQLDIGSIYESKGLWNFPLFSSLFEKLEGTLTVKVHQWIQICLFVRSLGWFIHKRVFANYASNYELQYNTNSFKRELDYVPVLIRRWFINK